jgi:hypothetical protein
LGKWPAEFRSDTVIEIFNDFHNSSVSLRAEPGQELSLSQIRRAQRTLCGISDCLCGGSIGQRGEQSVRIEVIGYDRQGHPRIRVDRLES